MLCSPGRLEHQTADVVALCVPNGDEYPDSPNDEIVDAVYILLHIVHAQPAGYV